MDFSMQQLLLSLLIFCIYNTSYAITSQNDATEELFGQTNHTAFTLSINYTNTNTENTDNIYDIIDDNSGTITLIPITQLNTQQTSDIFSITPSIITKLTDSIDLSIKSIGITRTSRHYDTNDISQITTRSEYISSIWLGFIKKIHPKSSMQSIFLDIAIAENINEDDKYVSGKSWVIGYSTSKNIAPITLGIDSSYIYTESRAIDSEKIDPANSLSLSPFMYFLVNKQIVITSGAQLTVRNRVKIDNIHTGIKKTELSFNFGLIYATNREHSYKISIKSSENNQSNLYFSTNFFF